MIRSAPFQRRYTSAGAPPGAFVTHREALAARMKTMVYGADFLEEAEPANAAEIPAESEGRTLWLDVRGLGDHALIDAIGMRFGLHQLVLADIVNTGQRPKAEDYGDVLFVVMRMAVLDENESIGWEQISVVIGRGFVLSFQESWDDCLDPLRARLRGGKRLIRTSGADYLGVMIVDGIVDGYFPVMESLGDALEGLEERVLGDPSRSVLAEIHRMKRQLMIMRRALWPMRDALAHLLRDGHDLLGVSTRPYLRDASDHAVQITDVLETYRELASSLVDIHLSGVSNRTNEVMRVLTVLATIFIPLTFLAGVYGMNFDQDSPLNMPELGWRYGYVFFWGIAGLVAGGLLLAFRRLGWLRGNSPERSNAPGEESQR